MPVSKETDPWKQGLKDIGKGRGWVRMRDVEQAFSRAKPKAKLGSFQVRRYNVCMYALYPENCMAPKLLSSPTAGKLLLG